MRVSRINNRQTCMSLLSFIVAAYSLFVANKCDITVQMILCNFINFGKIVIVL